VRGDSLRDLYAKTLALVGLGMLAGTGALVDYWPVGTRLPMGADVSRRLDVAPSSVDATGESEVAAVAAPAHAAIRASVRRTPARSLDPAGAALTAVTDAQRLADPESPAPADPAPLPFSTNTMAGLIASTVLLGPPTASEMATPRRMAIEPPAIAVAAALHDLDDIAEGEATGEVGVLTALADARKEPGDGLITGAFKRTGSSIVKTGARTGASIFDAVRVVSGVMRRAIPTN
jgi:hypothetical protein